MNKDDAHKKVDEILGFYEDHCADAADEAAKYRGEFYNRTNRQVGERELHGMIESYGTLRQSVYHPPILGYLITGLFAGLSVYFIKFNPGAISDSPVKYIFYGFSFFLFTLTWLMNTIFRIYMLFGGEEKIAIVDSIGESNTNSTTLNNRTKWQPRLTLHLLNGEQFYYEFRWRKPKELKPGDEVPIIVKGKMYKPVEKLYKGVQL